MMFVPSPQFCFTHSFQAAVTAAAFPFTLNCPPHRVGRRASSTSLSLHLLPPPTLIGAGSRPALHSLLNVRLWTRSNLARSSAVSSGSTAAQGARVLV